MDKLEILISEHFGNLDLKQVSAEIRDLGLALDQDDPKGENDGFISLARVLNPNIKTSLIDMDRRKYHYLDRPLPTPRLHTRSHGIICGRVSIERYLGRLALAFLSVKQQESSDTFCIA